MLLRKEVLATEVVSLDYASFGLDTWGHLTFPTALIYSIVNRTKKTLETINGVGSLFFQQTTHPIRRIPLATANPCLKKQSQFTTGHVPTNLNVSWMEEPL